VFEHTVLKILFGTKAAGMDQAGIPATLADLCWEGVWFESHLEGQISWLFIIIIIIIIIIISLVTGFFFLVILLNQQ
jgi:hypothetical protein